MINKNTDAHREPTRGEKIAVAILAVIAFAASGMVLYSFAAYGEAFVTDNFILEISAGVIVVCLTLAYRIMGRTGNPSAGKKP